MNFFYHPTGRNLIIQTGKIGDFINITPMLRALKQSEVLISRKVQPLAFHDDTIINYFLIEDKKRNFFTKLRLVFTFANRYDNIYLVYPNTFNLFIASLCNAPNRHFLITYAYKSYHKIFYFRATNIIDHKKENLTLNSYLKLINKKYCYKNFPKHATSPLHIPNTPNFQPYILIKKTKKIKIGISISAGNQNKRIPTTILKKLIENLSHLQCIFFIFGSSNEQKYLKNLLNLMNKKEKIVNLIGLLKLEEVPWAIKQMNFYVSSDSGNAYIADTQNVPLILFYGPCNIKEQRPTHKVLFLGPKHIKPSSFVFNVPSKLSESPEILFKLNENDLLKIKNFIDNNI